MGDSLRANGERMLRDIQRIHGAMLSDLDRVTPGGGTPQKPRSDRAGSRSEPEQSLSDSDEALDVPDFIPKG
jgi:hypothetical protein